MAGEVERDVGPGGAARAVAFEGDLDAVAVAVQDVLSET